MYPYITENNLENRQTYFYTTYQGLPFLEIYFKTREVAAGQTCSTAALEDYFYAQDGSESYKELLAMLRESDGVSALALWIKRFEVRKVLYTAYLTITKPQENATYEEFSSYLLFAYCLVQSYEKMHDLRSLSCLLKVSDTLLSVWEQLDEMQRKILSFIIERETCAVKNLIYAKEGEFCNANVV